MQQRCPVRNSALPVPPERKGTCHWPSADRLLRGTVVNRTYAIYKNLSIYLFLVTIFGPIYYGPQ